MKAIRTLRAKWPECYIIVYSAHLNSEVTKELNSFPFLAIIEKPKATQKIVQLVDDVLKDMQ